MALCREAFLGQIGFFAKYLKTKAPLPKWLNVQPDFAERHIEGLSEPQQLAYLASEDLKPAGIDPNSKIGRQRIAATMQDVLQNYDWLN